MKGKFESLVGKKFERLTVEEYMGGGRWWCNCECGGKALVKTWGLKSGHSKSCGCFHKDKVTKHGFWNTDYSKGTMKFYKMWQSLKARCDNPNLKCYKNYGSRGITYDPRWEDFLKFKEDMYMEYLYVTKQLKFKNASLERVNVNGDYCKENCIFVEFIEQMKNTRDVIIFIAISPEGKKYLERNVNEFSRKHGLNSSHIYTCLNGKMSHYRGWRFKKR